MPVVSAVLLALSYPPLHLLVPPFVGLVPLAVWVAGLPPDAEGRAAAVRGSMLFGLVYFGLVFYWILVALIWFTSLAILAYLAALAGLVAIAALFGWMLHRITHAVGAPIWLALPVAWTATEWVRAHLPSTIAFPWLGLGTSLTGYPELVGIAELVGARGVTFWMALVNGLLAAVVAAARRRERWAPGAAAVVVVAVPMLWGVWRAGTLEMREAATVAVVQPNIPEHIKLDTRAGLDSTFVSLERLLPRLAPGSADLVVMPEVTLRVFPEAAAHAGWMTPIEAWADRLATPILLGALGLEGDVSGAFTPFNSAFLVRPGEGLTDYRYDKRYLVPFVERVPFLPGGWLSGLRYFGSFGVGQGWPLSHVAGTDYGVLICYESSYPEGSRRFRLAGADVLLNITNDAWYGREPLYARTTALWQHPAHMVMRAIENRMGVARSANTGISLFVDPVGRVHDATALFEADLRVAPVLTTDVLTFYTRYGDLVGNGSALAALLLVAVSLRATRRTAAA